jgi:hypothetical protein
MLRLAETPMDGLGLLLEDGEKLPDGEIEGETDPD